MLNLPGGGAMLFLTDVDHVSFEKANGTRQNNLQSATVSLQVVIGLCKRKETAALKIKAAVSNERVKLSALRRLFFFCRRAAGFQLFTISSPALWTSTFSTSQDNFILAVERLFSNSSAFSDKTVLILELARSASLKLST